jgi:hypothetical protein
MSLSVFLLVSFAVVSEAGSVDGCATYQPTLEDGSPGFCSQHFPTPYLYYANGTQQIQREASILKMLFRSPSSAKALSLLPSDCLQALKRTLCLETFSKCDSGKTVQENSEIKPCKTVCTSLAVTCPNVSIPTNDTASRSVSVLQLFGVGPNCSTTGFSEDSASCFNGSLFYIDAQLAASYSSAAMLQARMPNTQTCASYVGQYGTPPLFAIPPAPGAPPLAAASARFSSSTPLCRFPNPTPFLRNVPNFTVLGRSYGSFTTGTELEGFTSEECAMLKAQAALAAVPTFVGR